MQHRLPKVGRRRGSSFAVNRPEGIMSKDKIVEHHNATHASRVQG